MGKCYYFWGNIGGVRDGHIWFDIAAKALTDELQNITGTFTYNGSAHTPAVTVAELKEGEDYTLSYLNNTNAGTATITVKGKGNYSGTLSKNFTIAKAAGNGAALTINGWTYGGTASAPSVNGQQSAYGAPAYEYKISAADDNAYTSEKPAAAGTYTVRAKFEATANYEAYSVTADFTISKAAYSGSAPAAEAESVTKNSITIKAVEGAEYSIDGGATWQDCNVFENLEPGAQYNVAVRIKGTGNISESSASDSLKIFTEKSGLPDGAIAGIVIACVFAAALGGFAIFWFVIKKKNFADLTGAFKKNPK